MVDLLQFAFLFNVCVCSYVYSTICHKLICDCSISWSYSCAIYSRDEAVD